MVRETSGQGEGGQGEEWFNGYQRKLKRYQAGRPPYTIFSISAGNKTILDKSSDTL